MSLETLREAMGTALRTITVNSRPLYATPYMTDKITPPHAMFDLEVEYDLVFGRGADVYPFTVRVFVQRDSEREGQRFLDGLRDPAAATCLKTVLEANATLAAQVDYVRLRKAFKIEATTIGVVDYLSVDFEGELVI